MTDLITNVKDKLKAKPEIEVELWDGWNKVCDAIQARALKKKYKVFELHHENETARKAYLTAFVNDKTIDVAIAEALNSIGLE